MGVMSLPKKREGMTMKAVLIKNIPKGVAISQAGMEDGQGGRAWASTMSYTKR